jgi:ADP-ribosyl-[dinitrogen reductase] hydrolase
MNDRLSDSILGCIIAGAIGDATGAAFENQLDSTPAEPCPGGLWQLTDDTQLTLATCEAITEAGFVDPAAIAASFLRWFRAQRLSGLGASTLKALRDLDAGAHWALAGRKGDRAAGNGAAMRIAPLAFCVDPEQEESRRLIRDVCRITHHNDEAYVGALAVILAVRAVSPAFLPEPGLSLQKVAASLPDTSVRDRLLTFENLPTGISLTEVAKHHGASGYVVESVPFALLAAKRFLGSSLSRLLKEVVSAGGDTDTNASLAAQVMGAALGLHGLPRELVDQLPEAQVVLEVAGDFAATLVSRMV